MAKFVSSYVESYGTYVVSAALSVLLFKFVDLGTVKIDDLLYDKLVDFSGILFGFLITVLTILIQTNNSATATLKKHDRFNDLISLNKVVITISAVVCAYTLGILALKESVPLVHLPFIKKWSLTGLFFLTSSMVFKTYSYLRIFYKIIVSN